MIATLDIARVRNRYEVPSGFVDGHALARRGDALTRDVVFQGLERRIPELLANAGLPPTAVVALRDVAVRVQLRDTDTASGQLAEAWVEVVCRDVAAQLAGAGGRRVLSPDLVVIPDRAEAEELLLGRIVTGATPEWWWDAVTDEETLRRPAKLIAAWVTQRSGTATARLARLLRHAPGGTQRLLAGSPASTLLYALARRREARWRELQTRDDRSACELRLVDPRVIASLTHVDRRVLRGLEDPAVRRLAAFVFVLQRRPATRLRGVAQLDALLAHLDTPPDRSPRARSSPTAAEADNNPAVVQRTEPTRSTGPHQTEASRERVSRTTPTTPLVQPLADAPPIPGEPPTQGVHATAAGGLLFAARWTARHVLDDSAGPEPGEHLLALGVAVLDRIWKPLPTDTAERNVAAEAPLLAVFAGLEPEVVDASALDRVRTVPWRAEVDALATRLARDLPEDLRPLANTDPRRLPPNADDRRLAALVLRAGSLTLTTTHADLTLPLTAIDVSLRREGWDIDPGWLPHLGRILRIQYLEP